MTYLLYILAALYITGWLFILVGIRFSLTYVFELG